jgi:hypothetical protein
VTTRVGRRHLLIACAVVATSSALIVNDTFAQTATGTSPSREQMAGPVFVKGWSPLQSGALQQQANVDEIAKSAPYVPPTAGDRLKWTVDGTVGPHSIATGVFMASWNTAWNLPPEWGASWSGFGKRFAAGEAQGAISNTVEAGLGAAWGEDPRYFRSGRGGIWARTGYAAEGVFMARRRDGRLSPAWARYVGAIGSNLVANTWLPESDRTALDNLRRIGNGFLGRFVGNLWMEFWPDVRRRLAKRD